MTTKTIPPQYFFVCLVAILAACTQFHPQSAPTTAPGNNTQTSTLISSVTQIPTNLSSEMSVISSATLTAPEGQLCVIISGTIDNEKGTGSLESMYIVDAQPEASASGPYAIRFENNLGQEVATYALDSNKFLTLQELSSFILPLPWNADTTRIVLLKDSVELDSRSASANKPEIHLISPNGGETLTGETATISWSASDADDDALQYVVQFSGDNGNTWQALTVDWADTTLEIDPSFMTGTDTGLIRILASDGFHTSQDQSDAVFSIATKAPLVEIDTHDGATFASDQTVTLEGSSYDMEGGQLPDSSLQWSSDLDGILGHGESISINALQLSEGAHTITLTAQDSDLQTSSASITIHIYREFSSLSVDEVPLSFTARQDAPTTTKQYISVWHLGNHPVTWSATADQSWIILRSTGSNTPADLIVSANPAGLPTGTYTGTITFTSNAEGFNSKTVSVTLVVQ